MASYQGATHSEPAKLEQIITEFFAKSLHIILESRCAYVSSRNYSGEQVLSSPSPTSSSSSTSSFRPRDKWFNLALRDCPSALENIDFWRQSNLEPMIVDVILVQRKKRDYYSSENEEFASEINRGKIIERWFLQYESRTSINASSGSRRSTCSSSQTLYKKSILLLRSLYATVRLLPAYKLFRDLISSAQIRKYNLGHRVSCFVEPFTRVEEADMQQFVFTPVDTFCGRLCVSVLYHSSVLDVSCEPSTPISPQFIPEYVGSPLAEPSKRLPSSSPFERRHSWSYDLYRASSSPSLNPSPSPTYSESHSSVSKQHSHRLPPAVLPPIHLKNPSFDEYWPSPMFTSSPSASPPISKPFLRSESAPVSTSITSFPNNQMLPPSKATRPNVMKTADKLVSSEKDVAERTQRQESSSNISSAKSCSRSSSRFSYQDDYDESEFSGPFVVDDDDITDPRARPSSFGALVQLLKKAPSLSQDISDTSDVLLKNSPCNPSSGLSSSKTIADALEELGGYREMKNLMLERGKTSHA